VIPGLVLLPIWWREGTMRTLRVRDLAVAALLFAAIGLPWYVAMWMEHGAAYFESFFIGDNFERFATDRFNDPRPWWFYVPVVAGGLLPWTPLALTWLGPITSFIRRRREIHTIDLRLLMWAILPLLFYTLSVGKQPRYVLPVLPPLALLLASSIVERTQQWRGLDGARSSPRRALPVVVGSVLSGAFLCTLGVSVYRAQPLLINVQPAYTTMAAAVIAVMGALVILTAVTRHWRMAPGVLAVAAAITLPTIQYGALSSGGDDTVQQMARLVVQHRSGDEAVGTYGVFVRNLVFYSGARTTDIIDDEQARNFLAQPDRALMVAPAEWINRLEREHGLTLHRIAELPYFNEAGLRVRTLLWPDPARDLARVVLVVNR
jgi:4-amino-4-deoxy-L-arabinose transferase-like glycosyltransferase